LKTQKWVLKPKGISKQAKKVSVQGSGRRAGGCQSGGVDVETSEKDTKAAVIVRPVRYQQHRVRAESGIGMVPWAAGRAEEQTMNDVQPEKSQAK
jgi:carbon monoxide dehydrogenase subunit G